MLKTLKTQRKTNAGTIAAAAIIGGLAGIAVGLIFAPKSGKELRQGISERAGNVRDHVEDVTFPQAGAIKQQGADLVDKGKRLAEDLQNFIQESLKIKKADYIPINDVKVTQTEESSQSHVEGTYKTLENED